MKEQLLATAIVGKTHGVNGFLRINSLSGEYEHLLNLDSCLLKTKDGKQVAVTIEDVKVHSSDILFKFVGYDAPEKSRFLSGSVMYIPRNKAPRLKKGEYYIADLIGLNLVYDSKTLGTVEYLSDGAQGLYLNVRDINGNLKIIPNIPHFVSKPDFEKKEITLLIKELMD